MKRRARWVVTLTIFSILLLAAVAVYYVAHASETLGEPSDQICCVAFNPGGTLLVLQRRAR
jgi:hypothetical protein